MNVVWDDVKFTGSVWNCHNFSLSVSLWVSASLDDLMSWLKTFTLSLEVISAAVETLYHLGHSEDIKLTQVGDLAFSLQLLIYRVTAL